jgi:hypothetical protein
MAERVLDVHTSAALLHGRWRQLVVAGAVGLVLGSASAALTPGQFSSTAIVLVPSGGSSTDEIETQARIVVSQPVLAKAGTSVTPALSAGAVLQRVSIDTPTTKLLQIQAQSTRAAGAQALAQAVAEAFVANAQEISTNVTAETLTDLQSRQATLDQQLSGLQKQIDATSERERGEDPTSFAGRRDVQLLAQLTAEQSNTALELDRVKGDISGYRTLAGDGAASIIQPAAPATGPSPLIRLVSSAGEGALLSVLVVAAFLLVRLRRDPRVRMRDDFADAVGSPVIADVRSRSPQSVAEWLTFFGSYQASPVDAWSFRRILRALWMESGGSSRAAARRVPSRVEHPSSITVLCLADDRRGIAVAPQLAVFAASLGIRTRLLVATGGYGSAALWAACAKHRDLTLPGALDLAVGDGVALNDHADADLSSARGRPSARGLEVPARIAALLVRKSEPGPVPAVVASSANGSAADSEHDLEPSANGAAARSAGHPNGDAAEHAHGNGAAGHPDGDADSGDRKPNPDVELSILLAVVDRREPTLTGIASTEVTVLAASPGIGTANDLARLAVAVDDAGRRIDGIVLADPDPADRTTGRHLLEDRVRQGPLPAHLTGMSDLSGLSAESGSSR